MKLEVGACTHVGRRDSNEDAFLVEPELGLFGVADGMGGYEGGEVASATVVRAVADFFRRNAADPDATWPGARDRARSEGENLLANATRLAHEAVCEQKHGRLERMGSTLAALAIQGGQVAIAHVGDSRVYRLRDAALVPLTRDHSLYMELEAAGARDLGPRGSFPYANVITRAIGMGGCEPDLRTEALCAGDVFLICTDGLFECLPEARIAALLAQPLEVACQALCGEAHAAGGRDNITAVAVRVLA